MRIWVKQKGERGYEKSRFDSKETHCVIGLLGLICTSVVACDLGGALSNALERSANNVVNNTVNSVANTIKHSIRRPSAMMAQVLI